MKHLLVVLALCMFLCGCPSTPEHLYVDGIAYAYADATPLMRAAATQLKTIYLVYAADQIYRPAIQ